MKAKLSYTVRTTRAPGETKDSIIPVIVERLNPVELETVVENCIDRGLVAGLKPTAARGIAEGVAAQIAREFSLGRGVQFGQYFYGRPYLSGTVDANGLLTGDNGIKVRLYKGAEFRLTLDDFSFTFDGAGDSVKIDSVYGDTTDAGGNTYGQVVEGSPVKVNGRNLYAAGDTDKVTFAEVGGGSTVEVTDFSTQGADMLAFAWPDGLVAGKSYRVTVERTDVNGVTRTGTGRKVFVVAAAVPPVPVNPPEVTGYEADLMPGEPIYMNGGTLQVTGTNLAGATKVRFRYAEDGEPFYEADVVESTDTSAECGPVGYTGTLEASSGYLSVITPGGESNKIGCGFNQ